MITIDILAGIILAIDVVCFAIPVIGLITLFFPD